MTDHESAGPATAYRFAGRDYTSHDELAAAFADLGYPLSEQGLAALASAVASGSPSHQSMDALSSTFRGRLLEAYGRATGQPWFAELDERWHAEFDRWAALVRAAAEAGGPDLYGTLAWRARAWLLQALIRPEADAAIRERARSAARGPAASRPWFPSVDPEGSSPGEALAVATLGEAPLPPEPERPPSLGRRLVRWAVALGVLALVVVGVMSLGGGGEDTGGGTATPTGAPTGEAPPVEEFGTEVLYTAVNPAPVDLLDDPDPSSPVTGSLEADTVVEVLKASGDYYGIRVKTEPETVGWVLKAELTIKCQRICNVG